MTEKRGAIKNKAALNLATLGSIPIETKIYAAKTAGFGAVGVQLAEVEETQARKELRLNELAVFELEGVAGWMTSGASASTLSLLQAERAFGLAAELDAELVVAWPGDEPMDNLAAARHFAALCRAAKPFGIKVGLEFLARSATVSEVATAWRIVDMSEAENGGLVIDAFHFVAGKSRVEMLEQIPVDRILLVQVSGLPDLPFSELENRHRLYPGEGSMVLDSLLSALRAKDYGGPYSLELYNEEYWSQDPLIVAADGMRAMRKMDLV